MSQLQALQSTPDDMKTFGEKQTQQGMEKGYLNPDGSAANRLLIFDNEKIQNKASTFLMNVGALNMCCLNLRKNVILLNADREVSFKLFFRS